jgi:hypothetical protein
MDKVLGTPPVPALEINQDLDRYMSLVSVGEGQTEEAAKLRRVLDEKLGGIANVPKLADADAHIAFYDLDE